MEELEKHGRVGKAALRAGMHRNTATRYSRLGKLPSELKAVRSWRTRDDPFVSDWPEIEAMLSDAPSLEAKTIFEHMLEKYPEKYHEGQLRTLQRRVRQWRSKSGPPKEVFFAQQHRPGEAMQTDFTSMNELGVTIAGEAFEHLLCHVVLPYSNWEWGRICSSESMLALREGIQAAVFRLGRVPRFHQTDNSTAATHRVETGKREFNEDYLALMRHLGMTPRTTGIGEKEQNGDIEAANGAAKRRIEQHLLLRGSRDFESVEAYASWLERIFEKANALRQRRLVNELEAMKPLAVSKLVEFSEERVRVSSWSTISVKRNAYSVPSRLIGETVKVRVYESRIEVYLGSSLELSTERLRGEGKHRIDYRHVIFWLNRKPGAFARYRFREEMYPTLVFRRAFDVLSEALPPRQAEMHYLRVLNLAATTMQADVEASLAKLLEAGEVPRSERVAELVAPETPEVPALELGEVDLSVYDSLVEAG